MESRDLSVMMFVTTNLQSINCYSIKKLYVHNAEHRFAKHNVRPCSSRCLVRILRQDITKSMKMSDMLNYGTPEHDEPKPKDLMFQFHLLLLKILKIKSSPSLVKQQHDALPKTKHFELPELNWW